MGRTLQRYKKLFQDLKKNPPHRVYFLYGPEEYIKKEFVSELMKRALPAQNQAFNLDIIHGDEFDSERFDDGLGSFPLFGERRMIVLKKFDALAIANKDLVIDRLSRVPDSLVVVVEARSDKLDSARLKKLDKVSGERAMSFRFQFLADQETVERVRDRLHREGLSIEPEALDLLVTSVGTQLTDLTNELDKIIPGAGDNKTITRELVGAVVDLSLTKHILCLQY